MGFTIKDSAEKLGIESKIEFFMVVFGGEIIAFKGLPVLAYSDSLSALLLHFVTSLRGLGESLRPLCGSRFWAIKPGARE